MSLLEVMRGRSAWQNTAANGNRTSSQRLHLDWSRICVSCTVVRQRKWFSTECLSQFHIISTSITWLMYKVAAVRGKFEPNVTFLCAASFRPVSPQCPPWLHAALQLLAFTAHLENNKNSASNLLKPYVGLSPQRWESKGVVLVVGGSFTPTGRLYQNGKWNLCVDWAV